MSVAEQGGTCQSDVVLDLVGVGIGPFNLALAALAEPVRAGGGLGPDGLHALFLEQKPAFSWHPGMLIEGATLQVPFLADLVSLVDPTSRFSVLNWLRETGRLYSFYFGEDLFLERREYEAYCGWVAGQLASCRFGARVTSVRRVRELFEVGYSQGGQTHTVLAANVVLGIGTVPRVPAAVQELLGPSACHSADYLTHRDLLRELPDVTVVGSGQSGAEVVLDLLRTGAPGQRVRWLTRSAAFEPMEYSKLGLEHFTPDYTRFFHSLRPDVRSDLLRTQGRLHKAISAETIAELHAALHARSFAARPGETGATLLPGVTVTGGERDGAGLRLDCLHARRKQEFTVHTDAVVFATGYTERAPDFLTLDPETDLVGEEPDLDYQVTPGLFVQNAERRSHGVGAPDLGLGAHRAAVVLNAVAGRPVYPLPGRTAHTAFDPAVAAAADPGLRLVSPAAPPDPLTT